MPAVVVVGAGAGGLLAAGRAAERGLEVILLERGPKTARKLRIAGKGRANITNTADVKDFIAAFGTNGKFLHGAFSRFFTGHIVSLLHGLGVETKVERGGRVFPTSDDADDVADALEKWCIDSGVKIWRNVRVADVIAENGRVVGVDIPSGMLACDAVILATGGITYPATGSTGDGYRIAQGLGHTVIATRPALTAMVAEERWTRDLQGLSLRNVEARLYHDGALVGRQFGEMLFTHFGVSGPIILTLSRMAVDLIGSGKLEIGVNLKPALSDEQLEQRFIREFNSNRHFKNYLPELMPRRLIPVFTDITAIDPRTTLDRITTAQRRRIIDLLHNLKMTIVKLRPPEEAIVTAGGVDIREINPKTMESKVISGLYLVGEVIDIDATTGGYNLQAAFTTGWVAGDNAGAT